MDLIITIVIGAIVGWLAGKIFKGGGFGLIGNIVVGIIGGWIGSSLFGALGLGTGGIVGFIGAVIGAGILLWIISLVKK